MYQTGMFHEIEVEQYVKEMYKVTLIDKFEIHSPSKILLHRLKAFLVFNSLRTLANSELNP